MKAKSNNTGPSSKGGKTSPSQPELMLNERLAVLQFPSGVEAFPPHVRECLLSSVTGILTSSEMKLKEKLAKVQAEVDTRTNKLRSSAETKIAQIVADAEKRRAELEANAKNSLQTALNEAIDLEAIGAAFTAPAAPPPTPPPTDDSKSETAPATGDGSEPVAKAS